MGGQLTYDRRDQSKTQLIEKAAHVHPKHFIQLHLKTFKDIFSLLLLKHVKRWPAYYIVIIKLVSQM